MTDDRRAAWDLVLAGGGLANSLIAYRVAQRRPDWRVLVIESGDRFGGNHTWSFHRTDLTPDQQAWTEPFVAHRWPFYTVAFPGFHRRVDLEYRSATSDRLHEVLVAAGVSVRFGTVIETVEPQHVRLACGAVVAARTVIDGRGAAPSPHLRLGWQKFVGREIRTVEPHRMLGPIIMDATVDQHDGYRFVYVLPFDTHRMLVEDTYYADTPVLDVDVLRERIDRYVADKGWTVSVVLREETGVLPITLAGNIDAFWAERNRQPAAGLRAGLFHPTTGYSWPDAVRLADTIAALPEPDAGPVFAAIETFGRAQWRRQSFFRALNRMLFQAGRPERRWAVMRRFYRFPEAAIGRFYAGDLPMVDKLRLLAGKPPVPVGGAMRALMDVRVR